MKTAHIMTRNVVSVQPEATILQAAHVMLQHRISGLPVLDSDRHIVGIVTESGFLRRAEAVSTIAHCSAIADVEQTLAGVARTTARRSSDESQRRDDDARRYHTFRRFSDAGS
jgi:CBS-domain-containing membrane protein